MCGIVGAAARRDIVPVLINGLKALEYRGYDSAGIAVHTGSGLQRLRAPGKVRDLESLQRESALTSDCGIAHTRWATHGVPSTGNAHPHTSRDTVSVVHNGIIENHEALRTELKELGFSFSSETDSEVIAHLIEHLQATAGLGLPAAVQAACARLHGAFAIAVVSGREPDRVVGARRGSPLVVGIGQGEMFLASDAQALIGETSQFVYLLEGDIADIQPDRYTIRDASGTPVERPVKRSQMRADAVQRGEYRHYMLKEIHEQAQAVTDTLEGRLSGGRVLTEIFGVDAPRLLAATRQVQIVACGTSWHAGLVARCWIEQLARIPVSVEIASEYRYREPVVQDGTLYVSISQSGETMDTLSALRMAKSLGYLTELAICNVPESSIVRESALSLMTRAGPEIGVASTKAFTTQLTALALLALELARVRGLPAERIAGYVRELEHLPAAITAVLALDPQIRELSAHFANRHHALFLGRGLHYPIALEGALKLKEISYIHAEAYPAGELKHGPLALVDRHMPVIAVAPSDQLLEKLKSNIAEVRARGGEMFVFTDHANTGIRFEAGEGHILQLPVSGELTSPILFTLPLQLLAYHVAVLKGTDVDQPRNLAKSVTVE